MTDPVVLEATLGLLDAKRVREAEVGMPDHAPNVLDAPVDHRLNHEVGDRFLGRGFRQKSDVDPVVPHLDRKGRDSVVETAGRLPRGGVEVPPVPWTAQPSVLDGALTKRPTLVRTLVVERCVLSLEAAHANGGEVARHGAHTTLG